MTVLNLPPNSPEKLALTGQAAFDKKGETVDLHRSDLPAFTSDEYLNIAMKLAHSANEFNKPEPNVFEAGRIEQQFIVAPAQSIHNTATIYAEKAVNPPYNPAEFPAVVGVNLNLMRKNAMGEVLVGDTAKSKTAPLGDRDSYGLSA